ncbi:MAG: hypothetical protein GZ091_01760 [Paludibacter sp.]|nr:hypothetical protein [Paludibacter sp.]
MKKKLKYSQFKSFHFGKVWMGLLYGLMFVTLSSCEKHDFIDENVITGNVGPQAYWEVGSSTVSAGANVPFKMQYYSTNSEIIHSEVWYNLTEKIEKSVTCPWVTFTYSYNSTMSDEKRINQKIKEYTHSLAVWSDSLHAFTMESDFPVSSTLSTFSWVKPENFDYTKMVTYFGAGFMEHFKDSLYNMMKFADFKKMYLGLAIDFGKLSTNPDIYDSFKNYTDSTFDANSNGFVYHFPKNAEGQMPIPGKIKSLYDNLNFDQLIQGASGYNVEYKRSYSLKAIMRVYDAKGTYGTTVAKQIDIN